MTREEFLNMTEEQKAAWHAQREQERIAEAERRAKEEKASFIADLQKRIAIRKDLMEYATQVVKHLSKFEGKVVNKRIETAAKEVVFDKHMCNYYATDGYYSTASKPNLHLRTEDNWISYDENVMTIYIGVDENGRYSQEKTESLLADRIKRVQDDIAEMVKAIEQYDECITAAVELNRLIDEYGHKFSYHVRRLNAHRFFSRHYVS